MTEENTSAKLSAIEDNTESEPVANAAPALSSVKTQAVEILATAAANLYCDSVILLFDDFKNFLHLLRINNSRLIT